MPIIIPTRGRTNQQIALQSLPDEWLKRTTIVCPQIEAFKLRLLGVEVVPQPDPDWKIAQKRKWIIEEWLRRGCDKIVMLDDDLSFFSHISETDRCLEPISGEELGAEIQRLEEKLGPEFPHVGFGQRQFNNNEEPGWKIPGKMQCVLAYYLPIVAKEVRWDLVQLKSDYCASLQLLLKGYANAVWTGTVVEQRGFDAPGGCNTYRTLEMHNDETEKFAKSFPDYVSVEQRKYGRLEVTVQWQKALRD